VSGLQRNLPQLISYSYASECIGCEDEELLGLIWPVDEIVEVDFVHCSELLCVVLERYEIYFSCGCPGNYKLFIPIFWVLHLDEPDRANSTSRSIIAPC